MQNRLKNIKTAIVHDWLTGMRGGEKVLESLLDIFPDADIFTLIHNKGSVSSKIEQQKITTSFIDKLPFKKNKYRNYLPLFPTAIELFNFKNYNLILSTSHCVAKGIITPPDILHISYIHSPMRYVWDMYGEYFQHDKQGAISKRVIPLISNYLRIWDVTSSNRVDYFIANSKHVANRIWKYYRREAEIIHPPVDTQLFSLSKESDNYYLIISAFVPYKKIDLAIRTFNKLDKNLIIIGDGPEKRYLMKLAKSNIKFLDWISPDDLVDYLKYCRALIFPGEEDFGIVPVEAQACGKPVIAYARGGALESIIGYNNDNEKLSTGIFFEQQNELELEKAIHLFEQLNMDPEFIHNHAQQFSNKTFITKIKKFISNKLSTKVQGSKVPRSKVKKKKIS